MKSPIRGLSFTAKRAIVGLVGLAALIIGVVQFSAFESYVLELNAHLEPPPSVISKTILKNPLDEVSQGEVDAAYLAANGVAGDCIQADTNPPILVPIETCVFWVIRITVNNYFDNPISNVMVTDRYGAELGGVPLDSVPVYVEIISHSRGNSGRQSFDTQYRILWCVTGNLDEVNEECDKKGDDRDLMRPGEVATLDMLVFTKLNPSGRQEYTTACEETDGKDLCYELNSGANAKWIDTKTGSQMSESTDPLKVGTIRTTILELNTDIDFGTVYPGQVLTDHFRLYLSEFFIAALGQTVEYTISVTDVPCPAGDVNPDCPTGQFFEDIGDYMEIVRDSTETDTAKDNTTGAVLDSKDGAAGPDGDVSDTWIVTFSAPDFAGCMQKEGGESFGVLPDSEDCAPRDLRAQITIQVTAADIP